MKIGKHIVILLLLSLSFQFTIAQITDENTYLISQYFQINKMATSAVVKNLNIQDSNNQLQQSEVALIQIGDENLIDIKSSAENSQAVGQKGNQNYYQFINYYNNNPSNFNILQQGNSNSLQIYGQNSIIENMSILQKSNNKTLIITNY